MLAEVPRFHRAARQVLDQGDPDGQVLGDFLRTGGFSRYFTAHFALPLVAANHGMLSVSGSPAWRTVTGGSRRYVELAAKRLPNSWRTGARMTDRRMTASRRSTPIVARTSGFIPLPPKRAPRRSAAASVPPERA